MCYVYIIRSINFPDQEYIGATADLKRRRPEHNAGKSRHTAKFKPWELVWYCIPRQIQSAGIREVSQIPFRPGIRKETPLTSPAPLLPQHRIQPVA